MQAHRKREAPNQAAWDRRENQRVRHSHGILVRWSHLRLPQARIPMRQARLRIDLVVQEGSLRSCFRYALCVSRFLTFNTSPDYSYEDLKLSPCMRRSCSARTSLHSIYTCTLAQHIHVHPCTAHLYCLRETSAISTRHTLTSKTRETDAAKRVPQGRCR